MESPSHTVAPELSLPSLDLRLVARRAALPLALAVAAAAVVLLAGGPLHVLADALGRALSADPRWIAFGAVAELLSFAGYIALFWLVGRRATPRLDLRSSAEITLGGAAASRLLPTAGAGGAALTLWAIRKTGMGSKRAGGVLLTFLSILYGVFLIGIAVSGARDRARPRAAATATRRSPPPRRSPRRPRSSSRSGLPPAAATPAAGAGRVARGAALLGGSIREALGLLRRGDARLLGAPAWWAFDAAVLCATLHALGEPALARRARVRLLRRSGREHDARSPAPSAAGWSAR